MALEKKEHEDSQENWKAMVKGFLESFAKNFAGSFMGNLRERIEEGVNKFKRNMAAAVLFVLALIFLLVGVAMVLDQVIGYYKGLGYLIVGGAILFIGLIIKAIKK